MQDRTRMEQDWPALHGAASDLANDSPRSREQVWEAAWAVYHAPHRFRLPDPHDSFADDKLYRLLAWVMGLPEGRGESGGDWEGNTPRTSS